MAILKISNLNIIDKENKKIINNLSLNLEKNSFTTIIGNSNSGKTILMNAIFNLLPSTLKLDSGDIIYDNESIFKIIDYDNYRGNEISVIFTNSRKIFNNNYRVEKQIFDILLMKNIFIDKKAIKIKLYSYLTLLDIDKTIIKKYPFEINNKDIKKIVIIFTVLLKAKLLIIDDSFHRLDSITVKLIYLFLKKIKKEMTILFLTSINSSINRLSDKILYLYKGTILESLKYDKLEDYKLIHPYRELFDNKVTIAETLDCLTESSKECIYYSMCFKRENTCLNFDNSLKEYEKEHFLSCIKSEG